MIESIEKQNVANIVYNKMLEMIIEGSWKQGEMIPSENELCEAFSVSRNTIRQAVHRLSALGILCSRQGKGTFVEKINTGIYLNFLVPAVFLGEGDSISILEFMKSIQVECVRIVCRKASDEDIVILADFLNKMKTANDYDSYFEFDMDYHLYLAKVSENHLFIKSMEIIRKVLHVYLRDIVAFHGSRMSIDQHEECYEAIRAHDAKKAIEVMENHYDMLLGRMRDWLAKSHEERRSSGDRSQV
jgi:GntR family transcriptional repressor for pyruvate dehydrogenase complex